MSRLKSRWRRKRKISQKHSLPIRRLAVQGRTHFAKHREAAWAKQRSQLLARKVTRSSTVRKSHTFGVLRNTSASLYSFIDMDVVGKSLPRAWRLETPCSAEHTGRSTSWTYIHCSSRSRASWTGQHSQVRHSALPFTSTRSRESAWSKPTLWKSPTSLKLKMLSFCSLNYFHSICATIKDRISI